MSPQPTALSVLRLPMTINPRQDKLQDRHRLRAATKCYSRSYL